MQVSHDQFRHYKKKKIKKKPDNERFLSQWKQIASSVTRNMQHAGSIPRGEREKEKGKIEKKREGFFTYPRSILWSLQYQGSLQWGSTLDTQTDPERRKKKKYERERKEIDWFHSKPRDKRQNPFNWKSLPYGHDYNHLARWLFRWIFSFFFLFSLFSDFASMASFGLLEWPKKTTATATTTTKKRLTSCQINEQGRHHHHHMESRSRIFCRKKKRKKNRKKN